MKLIIKSLLCILAVILISRCEKGEQKKSSNLQIDWLKCYGGSKDDQFSSIIQTSDGGYLINGTTESKDGDVTVNNGLNDGWILKLDNQGSIEWKKSVGGEYPDYTSSTIQTSDMGFIVLGCTYSSTCDVCDAEGWVFKLDQYGEIEWENFYGGSDEDFFNDILQTDDGGYMVAGSTRSKDGDVTGNHGYSNGWIIKMNENREIEWQKCYGGSDLDNFSTIFNTVDGGYIVGGSASSTDGDIKGNHGDRDIWIIKLDEAGSIEWQKCYGGSGVEYFGSLIQTNDGGYMVAGESASNDGDVSGNHGMYDYWIIKLNKLGNIEWQKCYGGSDSDGADCIIQTSDGGFLIVGGTLSIDGDVTNNHGDQDGWILKLDNDGKVEWQKCIGGTRWDRLVSIEKIGDNKYIVGGRTKSNDDDISGNHGEVDFVIMTITLSDQMIG